MNDSRDLRKRILKMREINNIDQKNAPFIRSSEQDKKLNNRIQINVLETNKNKIKKNNFINLPNEENIVKKNIDFDHSKNNQLNNSYDAQFRILANKFNEILDVISDISSTVEKLEKVTYSKEKEYKVVRNKLNWFKLKPTVFILLIGLFGLAFFYLSTYLETLNIIIQDILSLV
jgi:hypothetical protein